MKKSKDMIRNIFIPDKEMSDLKNIIDSKNSRNKLLITMVLSAAAVSLLAFVLFMLIQIDLSGFMGFGGKSIDSVLKKESGIFKLIPAVNGIAAIAIIIAFSAAFIYFKKNNLWHLFGKKDIQISILNLRIKELECKKKELETIINEMAPMEEECKSLKDRLLKQESAYEESRQAQSKKIEILNLLEQSLNSNIENLLKLQKENEEKNLKLTRELELSNNRSAELFTSNEAKSKQIVEFQAIIDKIKKKMEFSIIELKKEIVLKDGKIEELAKTRNKHFSLFNIFKNREANI